MGGCCTGHPSTLTAPPDVRRPGAAEARSPGAAIAKAMEAATPGSHTHHTTFVDNNGENTHYPRPERDSSHGINW